MNRYAEGITVGAVAAALLFAAGVEASRPGHAATPPAESASQAALSSANPYQTAFEKARADLAKAQWRYEFAIRERGQAAKRLAAHGGSRNDLDASIAAVESAGAVVRADRTALAVAQEKLAKASAEPPAEIKIAQY
ncbi:MAG TPA: hypothetical protein VGV09_21675 [Steroidobacteraceae bacterium]|nr:hypothetical protein [Steroidobacteraceae bacterium]